MYALIIDDSRAMRRILRQIVEPLGFEILEASNGQEGLACLHQAGRVEVCLVDWNMPVMNGLQFIMAVRSDESWKDTKLVMVTTETEPSQMARALMAGVDEFVMKPFTGDILIDKLRLIGVEMTTSAEEF
ncbi:MAG: response regulator [Phycisphaerae bacterium]|jgi:two-component system chemotaxis response regulator CheY